MWTNRTSWKLDLVPLAGVQAIGVVVAVAALMVSLAAGSVRAQDESELARANREIANPLTNNTLLIVETDTFRLKGDISRKSRYGNITVFEPLIPVTLGESDWTLIARAIVPFGTGVSLPEVGSSGLSFDDKTGLGDIAVFGLFCKGYE